MSATLGSNKGLLPGTQLSREAKIDLIDYVRHMVRLSEKPVFDIRDYRQPLFHETDLKNRIGVTHDTADESGPIWLKMEIQFLQLT